MEGAPEDRPELICVLNQGAVGGSRLEDQAGYEWPLGLAFLQDEGEDLSYVEPQGGPGEFESRGGMTYPVLPKDGKNYLTDPARGLLLFVESLLAVLARRRGSPEPVFSEYLSGPVRELEWVM
jgi:hypothetical protein